MAGTDLGTGYGVRYLHPLLFSDTEGTSDLARELWGVGAHIADQPRVDGCGTCWIRGLAGLSGSLGLFYGRGLRSPLSPLVSLLVWVCYSWRLDICSLTLASRGRRRAPDQSRGRPRPLPNAMGHAILFDHVGTVAPCVAVAETFDDGLLGKLTKLPEFSHVLLSSYGSLHFLKHELGVTGGVMNFVCEVSVHRHVSA